MSSAELALSPSHADGAPRDATVPMGKDGAVAFPVVANPAVVDVVRQRQPPAAVGSHAVVQPAGTNHPQGQSIAVEKYTSSATNEAPKSRAKSRRDPVKSSVSGRWTAAEHEAFLKGLSVYGREWKKVARLIPTRTSAQIRSHAQKYFAKAMKDNQRYQALTELHPSYASPMPDRAVKSDVPSSSKGELHKSQSYIDTLNSIVNNPTDVESRVCRTLASLRERYKQLENELHKKQAQEYPSTALPDEAALGPASAALKVEQESLRKAAVARYQVKRQERQLGLQNTSNAVPERHTSPPCAKVSLMTMPSSGGFDCSDVLALSLLSSSFGGNNSGREKIQNTTISTIKDNSGLKLVSEQLRNAIEREPPMKYRKLGD